MKVFNTVFRGDMADNYELFGAELPVWFFVLVGLAELQQLDAWIGGIVSGTFRRLSRGDREITVVGPGGWSASGKFGRNGIENTLAKSTG